MLDTINNNADEIGNKKRYLNSIRNLPSIPIVMFEVTKLLDNPMTSTNELGKIISKDQGLTAKILTVANSPLYGLPRKVSTIEFAIVVLGFEQIKNIVIALSMIEAFSSKDKDDWNRKAFWIHSLSTALGAKKIADDLGISKTAEAFTAGLLHDLGISVIQRYFNKEFKQINTLVKETNVPYLAAEEQVLGMTHQDVGKFLAERWNLPQSLGDAIAFHHTPSLTDEWKNLTAVVHLADYMTNRVAAENYIWDYGFQLDENIISILNLGSQSYLDKLIENYESLFKTDYESIGI